MKWYRCARFVLLAAVTALVLSASAPGAELVNAGVRQDSSFLFLDGPAASAWVKDGTGMLFISDNVCGGCEALGASLTEYARARDVDEIRRLDSGEMNGEMRGQMTEYLSLRGTSFVNVSGGEIGHAGEDADMPICGLVAFYNRGVLIGLHVDDALGTESEDAQAECLQSLYEGLDVHLGKLGLNPCPGYC